MLGSGAALLSGCILDPISIITDPIMYAAYEAGPSEAEIKADHDASMKATFVNLYRGQTCEQITAFWPERKAAVAADSTRWGGLTALRAAEQVIGEKGCSVPTSTVATATATTATTATASPAAAVERDPATFAAVIANPPAIWGPVSKTGRRQSTLAQWVARETPAKYQNKSCDYLHQALWRSKLMESMSDVGTQAWGAYARVAVRSVLDSRNCPAWTSNGSGRIGTFISTIDPIKAPQLGMPAAGASVEKLVPGGNGERAGLQPFDVVVAVDSTPIADDVDFLTAIGQLPTGSSAMLKVWRKTTFLNLPVVVGPPLAPVAGTATAAASPASASPASLLDMQLGAVSADYAKAVGLPEAKGAWVIELTKGGQAERAGIKPLDVIIEVSGQEIGSPQDLAAIGAKMRKGYSAPVVVWRDRAKKELKVVLNNGALAAGGNAAPAAGSAVAPVTAAAQREFCYLYLSSDDYKKNPDVLSTVFSDPAANQSSQAQISVLKAFAAKVGQQQPGIWRDFNYRADQCYTSTGVCWAATGSKQSMMLRCFDTHGEATAKRSADESADPTATTIALR